MRTRSALFSHIVLFLAAFRAERRRKPTRLAFSHGRGAKGCDKIAEDHNVRTAQREYEAVE